MSTSRIKSQKIFVFYVFFDSDDSIFVVYLWYILTNVNEIRYNKKNNKVGVIYIISEPGWSNIVQFLLFK